MSGHSVEIDAALTDALYSTETASGWYGQPECAEVARILSPTVRGLIDAEVRGVLTRLRASVVDDLRRYGQAGTYLRDDIDASFTSVTPPAETDTKS